MFELAQIVCDVYGITLEQMRGISQESPLPEARQMAIYIMFREGVKGVDAAKVINRDKAIVSRYRTKIKDELPIYKATRDKYDKIIETIETIKNKE